MKGVTRLIFIVPYYNSELFQHASPPAVAPLEILYRRRTSRFTAAYRRSCQMGVEHSWRASARRNFAPIADLLMPARHRQLRRDDRRARLVAILAALLEAPALRFRHRSHA